MCIPLEAILRAKMEATEDPKKAAVLDEKVAANRAILEGHITALQPFIKLLEENGYKELYVAELNCCFNDARTKEFTDKESLAPIQQRITRLGQALFKEASTLLAKIKDIKKRCAAAAKAGTAPAVAVKEEVKACHPNEERTFIMLKPDAVQRGLTGQIISRFEQKGFKLVGMKLCSPGQEHMEKHYDDLKTKKFFPSLV